METEQIKKQCEDIRNVISDVISSSFTNSDSSEEEKKLEEDIKNQLSGLNESFKKEIDELSENAEWNKFSMAFLGETNAGKSTLIESMRILYNEESRLENLLKNRETALENIKINLDAYSKVIEDLKQISSIIKNNKWIYGKTRLLVTGIISFLCGASVMAIVWFFVR